MTSISTTTRSTPKANTEYNATAKFLHWVPVVLIMVQFPLGWLMPPTARGEVPSAAVNLHFSIGMLILILFVVRLLWKLAHPVAMEASLPSLQKKVAHAAHCALYGFTFSALLAGWANASVRGWEIKMFGLIPVPPICAEGSELAHAFGQYHATFACALLALIGIHVAGVLFHQFVQKDKILARMLPREGTRISATYATAVR